MAGLATKNAPKQESYSTVNERDLPDFLHRNGFANASAGQVNSLLKEYSANLPKLNPEQSAWQRAVFGDGNFYFYNDKNIIFMVKRGNAFDAFTLQKDKFTDSVEQVSRRIYSSYTGNLETFSLKNQNGDIISFKVDEEQKKNLVKMLLEVSFKSFAADSSIANSNGGIFATVVDLTSIQQGRKDIGAFPILIAKQEAVPASKELPIPVKTSMEQEETMAIAILDQDQFKKILAGESVRITPEEFDIIQKISKSLWVNNGWNAYNHGFFDSLLVTDSSISLFLMLQNNKYLQISVTKQDFEKEGFLGYLKSIRTYFENDQKLMDLYLRILTNYSMQMPKNISNGFYAITVNEASSLESQTLLVNFEKARRILDKGNLPPETRTTYNKSGTTTTSEFKLEDPIEFIKNAEQRKDAIINEYVSKKGLEPVSIEGTTYKNITLSKEELQKMDEAIAQYKKLLKSEGQPEKLMELVYAYTMAFDLMPGKILNKHSIDLFMVLLYKLNKAGIVDSTSLGDVFHINGKSVGFVPKFNSPEQILQYANSTKQKEREMAVLILQATQNDFFDNARQMGHDLSEKFAFIQKGKELKYGTQAPAGRYISQRDLFNSAWNSSNPQEITQEQIKAINWFADYRSKYLSKISYNWKLTEKQLSSNKASDVFAGMQKLKSSFDNPSAITDFNPGDGKIGRMTGLAFVFAVGAKSLTPPKMRILTKEVQSDPLAIENIDYKTDQAGNRTWIAIVSPQVEQKIKESKKQISWVLFEKVFDKELGETLRFEKKRESEIVQEGQREFYAYARLNDTADNYEKGPEREFAKNFLTQGWLVLRRNSDNSPIGAIMPKDGNWLFVKNSFITDEKGKNELENITHYSVPGSATIETQYLGDYNGKPVRQFANILDSSLYGAQPQNYSVKYYEVTLPDGSLKEEIISTTLIQ